MDEMVSRVLNEPPRWCESGMYSSTLLASAGMTAATHLSVRWLSRKFGWWHDSLDCDSRVVSTLNATVMLFMYRPRQWWLDSSFDNVLKNDCERDLCMISLVGYLVVDGGLCAAAMLAGRNQPVAPSPGSYADPLVLSHHALVATAFVVGIASRLATTFMAALIVNELSTPFVNLRVLIKNAPRSQISDALYLVNGIALVATYFLGRIAWISFVVFRAAVAWRDLGAVGWIVGGYRLRVVVILTLLLFGHLLINLLWFTKILKHLARLFRRRTFAGTKNRRDRR